MAGFGIAPAERSSAWAPWVAASANKRSKPLVLATCTASLRSRGRLGKGTVSAAAVRTVQRFRLSTEIGMLTANRYRVRQKCLCVNGLRLIVYIAILLVRPIAWPKP